MTTFLTFCSYLLTSGLSGPAGSVRASPSGLVSPAVLSPPGTLTAGPPSSSSLPQAWPLRSRREVTSRLDGQDAGRLVDGCALGVSDRSRIRPPHGRYPGSVRVAPSLHVKEAHTFRDAPAITRELARRLRLRARQKPCPTPALRL